MAPLRNALAVLVVIALAAVTVAAQAQQVRIRTFPLPGDDPAPYVVYVDEHDKVWLSDFSANAMLRFEPESETFEPFPTPRRSADVRQMLGCPGEVWATESGAGHLTVYRHE